MSGLFGGSVDGCCAIQTAHLHGIDARGDPLHSIANTGKDGCMTTSARYDTIRFDWIDRTLLCCFFGNGMVGICTDRVVSIGLCRIVCASNVSIPMQCSAILWVVL